MLHETTTRRCEKAEKKALRACYTISEIQITISEKYKRHYLRNTNLQERKALRAGPARQGEQSKSSGQERDEGKIERRLQFKEATKRVS